MRNKKGNFRWTDKSQNKVEFVEDPTGKFIFENILPQYKTCHGSDGNGKMYIGGIDPIAKSDLGASFGLAVLLQSKDYLELSKNSASIYEGHSEKGFIDEVGLVSKYYNTSKVNIPDKSKILPTTVEEIRFPNLLNDLWNLKAPAVEEIEVTPHEFFRTELSPFTSEPFIAFKDTSIPRTIPEVYRFRMFLKETRKRSKLNIIKYRRNDKTRINNSCIRRTLG